MNPIRLLINEDDAALRSAIKNHLTPLGYECQLASNGREGLRIFVREIPDVVLTALDKELVDGLEFIRRARDIRPSTPIVVLSSIDLENHLMSTLQLGANEVIRKPIRFSALDKLLRETHQSAYTKASDTASALLGTSSQIQNLRRTLQKLSRAGRSTILLLGESGTGKEVAAHEIHRLSECSGQFVPFNCALSEGGLIENALFGHERGAFTDAKTREKGLVEAAHSGTLFLDEIGEMHIETQAKLLRFLETGSFRKIGGHEEIFVETRVIAATHRDLPQMVRQHQFREDLYFRLNVLPVTIPPLRERREDLPLLAQHFIEQMSKQMHQPSPRISTSVLNLLKAYDWPGNVRELRNLMERFVLLQEGLTVDLEDLPPELTATTTLTSEPELPDTYSPLAEQSLIEHLRPQNGNGKLFEGPLAEARRNFELIYLERLLSKYQGNVSTVARASGLDPSNLRRTLKRHGLDPVTFRPTK
ncbi:MAG: sigma-54 dependent transcriptional regulator [Myxococcales bacterium]|nr:sigma-54 dependent transcriptional regulator [Myxococcales bacterium]